MSLNLKNRSLFIKDIGIMAAAEIAAKLFTVRSVRMPMQVQAI
jgi:hypothetical protein